MVTALQDRPRVGMLLSRVRVEEKLLLARPRQEWDVVLARSVSHSRTLYALRVLEGWGVPTVNRHAVVHTCGDKLLTTMALLEQGIPTPRTRLAFTAEAALEAVEES